ncbi:MAG TPA: hypothetical protein VFA50_11890 [Stellaceae bacterium]|nr:hypothetical protein [Stellaceae bacterium]
MNDDWRVERPRLEPEIIPPDPAHRRRGGGQRIFIAMRPGRRAPLATSGFLAAILAAFAVGALSVTTLALFFGAFVILVPLIGLVAAGFMLSGLIDRLRRGA